MNLSDNYYRQLVVLKGGPNALPLHQMVTDPDRKGYFEATYQCSIELIPTGNADRAERLCHMGWEIISSGVDDGKPWFIMGRPHDDI